MNTIATDWNNESAAILEARLPSWAIKSYCYSIPVGVVKKEGGIFRGLRPQTPEVH